MIYYTSHKPQATSHKPQATSHKLKSKGFTLIELSVVLVIIGLIVGGVLVGRDLIEVSQARSVISQMEGVQLAVSTFRLKYDCMPGDCDNASSFGLGTNGNGDKILAGTTGPTSGCSGDGTAGIAIRPGDGECQLAWVHMGNAGLINGSFQEHSAGLSYSEMEPYYLKSTHSNLYLYLLSSQNNLYVRTGLQQIGPGGQKWVGWGQATLSAAQARYIAEKKGANPIEITKSCWGTYGQLTSCTAQMQEPVIFTSTFDHSGNTNYLYASLGAANGVPGNWTVGEKNWSDCMDGDASNPVWYEDGRCDLFWKIDY